MESTLALNWEEKWRTVWIQAAPIVEGNTPEESLENDEDVGTETIETIEWNDDDDGDESIEQYY